MKHIITWLPDSILEAIKSLGEGELVYLVGGAVRDAILDKPRRDFDFVIKGSVRKKAGKIAEILGGDFYPLDEDRQMMRVLWYPDPGEVITLDFSGMQGESIEDDLMNRDFTINSMAVLSIGNEKVIDPCRGAQDLKDRILRRCRRGSVLDDPVRALRAVRLAVQMDLSIEPDTIKEINQAAGQLERISAERIRDELFRLFDSSNAASAIRILNHFGMLEKILPEISFLGEVKQSSPHTMDVLEHSLACINRLESILNQLIKTDDQNVAPNLTSAESLLVLGKFQNQIQTHLEKRITADRTRRALLIFAALYHDIGKPQTQTMSEDGNIHFFRHEIIGAKIAAGRLKSLANSNHEITQVEKIIRNHMRPNLLRKSQVYLTDRAIYRFFQSCGEEGVEVCLFSLADMLAKKPGPPDHEEWTALLEINRKLLDAWYNHREEKIYPQKLIDGQDLMQTLLIEPGPQVGEILAAIGEGQATGKIRNRRDALIFARNWEKEKMGKNGNGS